MAKKKVRNYGGDDILVFDVSRYPLTDIAIRHEYCYCRCEKCSAETKEDGRGGMLGEHCHDIQNSCFVRRPVSIRSFFRRSH